MKTSMFSIVFFSFLCLQTSYVVCSEQNAKGATSVILSDFENGVQGWWNYSNNGEIDISTNDGSMKLNYCYGKNKSWLGIGKQLDEKTSLLLSSKYTDGFLSLRLKAQTSCKIKIRLISKGGATYSITLLDITSQWDNYKIPFTSFSLNGESLILNKIKITKITISPLNNGSQKNEFWIDYIHFNQNKLPLTKVNYVVNVIAHDTNGKVLSGASVKIFRSKDLLLLAEAKTSTDGKSALNISNELSKYLRSSQAEPTGKISTHCQIETEAKGLVKSIMPVVLNPGVNNFSLPLKKPSSALPQIHIEGNRLKNTHGEEVWLQGICVDSLEWNPNGERILRSVIVAIDIWKSNVIRLPLKRKFWFGKGKNQLDSGAKYRMLVDEVYKECCKHGAYIILDLHGFGAPLLSDMKFWEEVSLLYANKPNVIFEIFNEPHGISWDLWREGGDLKHAKIHDDKQFVQNNLKNQEPVSSGMQALVNVIRRNGANNLIAASGISWSYDLSGILKGYALEDTSAGNGIMYVWHCYPWAHWKVGWKESMLDIAQKYPIVISEVGNIKAWEDFDFIKNGDKIEDISTLQWPRDMLGMIQKYRLNWTGFSFHPGCGPSLIEDWNYTPNKYWGEFAKSALNGKKYILKNIR